MFLSPCWLLSELREIGREIFAAVTCFLCIGPTLILVGIGFLVATSSDSRSAQVNTFNNAASAWGVGGGAGAFAAAAGQSFSLSRGVAGSALPLALVTSAESYGSDMSPDLHPPNSTVRFSASATSGRPFLSTTYSSDVSATVSLASAAAGAIGTSFPVQLFKTVTTSISCSSSH